MRYYVVEILSIKDGGEDRPQPYAFDDIDSAKKQYHAILAQDIKGEVVQWVLVMLVNEHGKVEMMERWDAPVETPVAEG